MNGVGCNSLTEWDRGADLRARYSDLFWSHTAPLPLEIDLMLLILSFIRALAYTGLLFTALTFLSCCSFFFFVLMSSSLHFHLCRF